MASRNRATAAHVADESIDVFALPAHPWAARFPMRSDDDLDAMAESIKANGLRVPVVLGTAATAKGFPERLCVIDGRNRIEACKRAGVTPHYTMLNGEDQDAFIADANLERRDLSKGQKAMLIAERFPVSQTHPGKKSDAAMDLVSKSISGSRVSQARTVLEYAHELVDLVIDGRMGLDAALQEATRRKQIGQAEESRAESLRKDYETRFAALRHSDSDLADLVNEDRLPLADAEASARERREREDVEVQSHVGSLLDIGAQIGCISGVHTARVAALCLARPADFPADLVAHIEQWIGVLEQFKGALRNEQAQS